ncbi:hypothetical protein QL285_021376 [Trifolium repens]|nr:hypothetical protein QL285_021376 [Trifolium repens]
MHFISCINNNGKHAYIKQVQRFLLAEYRLWSLNHKKGSLTSFLASRLVNCLPNRLAEKPYIISSPVICRFSGIFFYKIITTTCLSTSSQQLLIEFRFEWLDKVYSNDRNIFNFVRFPKRNNKQTSSTWSGSPKGMTAILQIQNPEIGIFSGIRRPEGGDFSSSATPRCYIYLSQGRTTPGLGVSSFRYRILK